MKRCFVIMGYGRKTDFETGRVLDLDRTYEFLIKPAVEGAGLQCIRADEIRHSGVIDVPMYDQLLSADVVVADISTCNANAFYELGIRHALRPKTTVVISEEKLRYPFDLNHVTIMRYVHHGDVIDVAEARRFNKELRHTIEQVLAGDAVDSPVYTFVTGLTPPSVKPLETSPSAAAPATTPSSPSETLAFLRGRGEAAIATSDWATAEASFQALRTLLPEHDPNHTYVAQRLTLATYKGQRPTHLDALRRARDVLAALTPERSNDPETLGLAGAIEKRLFELDGGTLHLNAAVRSYERGFYVRHDYYNGINLAFMLDVRAAQPGDPSERAADRVIARRVRRDVLNLCTERLAVVASRTPVDPEETALVREERYWLLATIAEAHLGLGSETESQQTLADAASFADKPFMRESTDSQLQKLRNLLAVEIGTGAQ